MVQTAVLIAARANAASWAGRMKTLQDKTRLRLTAFFANAEDGCSALTLWNKKLSNTNKTFNMKTS